jgi:hypothetical protein
MGVTLFFRKCFQQYISRYASIRIAYTDVIVNIALENSPICLKFCTWRHIFFPFFKVLDEEEAAEME